MQKLEPAPGVYYAVVTQRADASAATTQIQVTVSADTCLAGRAGFGVAHVPERSQDPAAAASDAPPCQALAMAPLVLPGSNAVRAFGVPDSTSAAIVRRRFRLRVPKGIRWFSVAVSGGNSSVAAMDLSYGAWEELNGATLQLAGSTSAEYQVRQRCCWLSSAG